MPSWQPNWADVRFDHLASALAVDALISAARRLEVQHEVRAALTAQATAEWSGPGHDRWVEIRRQLVVEHLQLGSVLRADARTIEDTALRARREQTNREVEREAWLSESAAEAAAAAVAGAIAGGVVVAAVAGVTTGGY